MRKVFKKFQPRIINYRPYKHFSNEAYRESLINKLTLENFVNNDDGFQRFCDISLATLNEHVPCKIKHVWGNQMPFFDKKLSKTQKLLCLSFKKGQKEILWNFKWKKLLLTINSFERE